MPNKNTSPDERVDSYERYVATGRAFQAGRLAQAPRGASLS